jgi:hypothetical protein
MRSNSGELDILKRLTVPSQFSKVGSSRLVHAAIFEFNGSIVSVGQGHREGYVQVVRDTYM